MVEKKMPTLEECMQGIRILVREKKHGDTLDDFEKKLLFAFIELGEASNIWKKHGFDKEHLPKLAEELLDVIFYILDGYGLLFRELGISSPDKVFLEKLEQNMKREVRYGRPKDE